MGIRWNIQKENEFFVIKYVTWKQRWSFFHSFFADTNEKMFHKSKTRKKQHKDKLLVQVDKHRCI